MTTLIPANEYDASYFDGNTQPYQRNGGYAKYRRWHRISDDWVPHEESTGEYFKDMAKYFATRFNLVGKKVLEIGSAKGWVVGDLREFGVDAYGIDVSQYAYDCADENVKPFLRVADVRTALKDYKNKEFDIIFSRWTLQCFSDDELNNILIPEMNRISKKQAHSITTNIYPEYYNCKPLSEWLAMPWTQGTILSDHLSFKTYSIK